MTTALILFAHGARDARWAQPFERLRELVKNRMPTTVIELAFLEFMQPDLPSLVKRLVADGCDQITLIPVFLGQGGHVLRDLPTMMEQLRQQYPMVTFKVAEAVGENPQVLDAIAHYCVSNLDP